MNIEDVISEFGGLKGSILFFGWQGGTIHQVKAEWIKRLHSAGHIIRKDGVICKLVITKNQYCDTESRLPRWQPNTETVK